MAQRWQDRAHFYYIYTQEAHPKGENLASFKLMTEMMRRADKDGDNVTTRAEFKGPDGAFAPLDINHDGVIQRYELLSSHKVPQFADLEPPTTLDDRIALARRFRAEIPGDIPVLLDDMKHSVRTAYNAIDNSAFIIDSKGRVTHRFKWAYVPDIDKALAGLLNVEVPTPSLPRLDWSVLGADLARARAASRPLLVHFTTPGCLACERMDKDVLADAEVRAAVAGFAVVEASLEHDPYWGLFEALGFSSTPAFAIVDDTAEDGPRARAKVQGLQHKADFLRLLGN